MFTLKSVKPLADFRVELIYTNSEVVVADFKAIIAKGGVFTALADPAVFRAVTLGEGGRYIEWPHEIDFCADALYMQYAGVVVSDH